MRLAASIGWALGAAIACAAAVSPVEAALLLSQDEALKLAFPAPLKVERETVYLTEAQLARARSLAGAGVEVRSALVTRYVARDGAGRPAGAAYFDTHLVRTLRETIMVVVAPDGGVGRVEILAFEEPPEYLPKRGWLEQFLGRRLDGELTLKRGIRPITGASLSSQAATDAVRRVLALHGVIP